LKEAKYDSRRKMQNKLIELEEELQYSKENLQATIEELQSSNEELQSTNEELQSTNEEIETSKEELQSLNEELVAVNSELQNKIDQLSSVHDDMNNLFNSTEIAAIFLDNELNIKRFTPKTQKLIPLIQSDIGRSIQHFSTSIRYEKLIEDAKEVINSLIPKSFEVRSKNREWYHIRILPYRTLTNVIDGVIITFDDITRYKMLEKNLNKLNKALNDSLMFTNDIIDTVTEPMLVLTEELKIISANRAFYKSFNMSAEKILDKFIYLIAEGQWDIPQLRKKLEEVIKKDVALKKFEIEQDFKDIGHRKLTLNALRIFRDELGTNTLLLVIREQ